MGLFGHRPGRSSAPASPLSLVLYTRLNCPLCDEMKAAIETAPGARPFELREVDVDSNAELTRRFGFSVPVLEIAGRVAFEGRLSADGFLQALEQAARGQDGGQPGGEA